MDLDNDHSEIPSEWKDINDVRAAFPGVPFYAVTSRNHMKPKKGKAPRPKYHVYFPIGRVTNAEVYKTLKELALAVFPYFDRNAADAARYLAGVENPQIVIVNEGVTSGYDA